jgi:hypothetical protein
LAGGLNLYGFAGGDPVNFSDPFGLCPNPPCFRVIGNAQFQGNWNQLTSRSPYLQGLVTQASNPNGPEFNLRQWSGSIQQHTQGKVAFGATYFFDAQGNQIEPGPGAEIARIDSYVSMADLNDALLVELGKQGGRNPTVSNTQVHEFGHGILGIQGYKSTEKQAQAVECKAMSEAGGSCRP